MWFDTTGRSKVGRSGSKNSISIKFWLELYNTRISGTEYYHMSRELTIATKSHQISVLSTPSRLSGHEGEQLRKV